MGRQHKQTRPRCQASTHTVEPSAETPLSGITRASTIRLRLRLSAVRQQRSNTWPCVTSRRLLPHPGRPGASGGADAPSRARPRLSIDTAVPAEEQAFLASVPFQRTSFSSYSLIFNAPATPTSTATSARATNSLAGANDAQAEEPPGIATVCAQPLPCWTPRRGMPRLPCGSGSRQAQSSDRIDG